MLRSRQCCLTSQWKMWKLATGEALTIGCDEYSVVIVCKRTCLNCYTEYKALNGYGNSTDFKGTCECGKTY